MIEISSIIAQITYGDWNDSLFYDDNLSSISPFHVVYNYGKDIIISKISEAHKSLTLSHRSLQELKCEILEILRSQPNYGSVFFQASNEIKNRQTCMWQLEQYGTVIIALNTSGLHFLDLCEETVRSFTYDHIVEWRLEIPDLLWFEVEAEGLDSAEENRTMEVLYRSKFSPIISSYMEDLSKTLVSTTL